MKITDFITYLNYCKDTLKSKEEACRFVVNVVNYPKEDVQYWIDTYWNKPKFGRKVYTTFIQNITILYDRILNSEIKIVSSYTVVYPVIEECKKLLASGNKLQAVKLYKDSTGLGLKESKDFIDSLWLKIL